MPKPDKPIKSDLVIDLAALDSVVSVDKTSRQVCVGSGITLSKLNDELASHGFELQCAP